MNVTAEMELRSLPEGWRWAKLGEACEINPRRPRNLERKPNEDTTFVPMAAIDARTGTISQPELRPFDAVSRGYTYFQENDVLFAKITPCMQNGKHTIAKNLIDGFGFGTTEFHVIRHGNDVTPQWIHNYVRQPHILSEATQHFRGAVGQQRLPKEFLIDLSIPLPPLAEQKRIVRILDEKFGLIEETKQAAEAQLEAADALPASYLREAIHSDLETLPEGWRWVRLSEVCREDKTTIKPEDEKCRRLPYMSLEHVESQTGYISIDVILNERKNVLSNTFAFDEQHVLYGKLRPYLNKVAVPDFEGRCTTEIIPLVPSGVTRSYLARILRRSETVEFAMKGKTGSRMPRTDMQTFMNLFIPLPPLWEQVRITTELDAKIEIARSLTGKIRDRLDALNAMSAAYLRRGFAGEL